MDAVSFDAASNELRFVPAFFKDKPDRFVSWRAGIRAGVVIAVGTALADIQWDDGTEEVINSPAAGTIVTTNRRVSHSTLHRTPAQLALVLVVE